MKLNNQMIVTEPQAGNPEIAGLAVKENEPHPAKGDYCIVNFFKGDSVVDSVVHFNHDEIDELIQTLEKLKNDNK